MSQTIAIMHFEILWNMVKKSQNISKNKFIFSSQITMIGLQYASLRLSTWKLSIQEQYQETYKTVKLFWLKS